MINTAQNVAIISIALYSKSSEHLRRKLDCLIWHEVYFKIAHSPQYQMRRIVIFDINPVIMLDPHYTSLL